jgi:F0F1-type ATP synthase epsilon subunit
MKKNSLYFDFILLADTNMHLSIITPNEILFSGKVEVVEIPTLSGTIGILPHHAPLTTLVGP